MKKYRLISLFVILFLLLPVDTAGAQEDQPDGPVYIVQLGDSLWDIALRFGISMNALAEANGITDPSQLVDGAQLVIPGLEGVQGVLVTKPVTYGESLRSLSRWYQVPDAMLAKLNHLTSPAELFAGYNLVIPQKEDSPQQMGRSVLAEGQSLLELAVIHNTSVWDMLLANQLSGTSNTLPGDVLLFPGGSAGGPSGLPAAFAGAEINPSPMLQGRTSVITLSAGDGLTLSGSLLGQDLHFFPDGETGYRALQGIHALAEPGVYPLRLEVALPDGTTFAYSQRVVIGAVNYPYDRPLTVDPATIDPSVTKPEDAEWNALAAPVTPDKLWDGPFQIPSPLPKDYCLETNDCWTSRYGNRRSYNGSPYNFFHTGLDIAGGEGTEIYAPASGVVVFAGPLTVRGKATMIDHGWGIYTGYMHQSEIVVEVGERVEPGQLIGYVGGTGRVEGPHLHWEVWAGGIQVDPLEWLERTFP